MSMQLPTVEKRAYAAYAKVALEQLEETKKKLQALDTPTFRGALTETFKELVEEYITAANDAVFCVKAARLVFNHPAAESLLTTNADYGRTLLALDRLPRFEDSHKMALVFLSSVALIEQDEQRR